MLVPYQRGRGGFPVYRGGPPYMGMQRGKGFGSVMGSLFRNLIVPAAKTVGKSLLRTGLQKASNVMRGVAEGQNIGDAVVNEFMPSEEPVEEPMVQQVPRRQQAVRRHVPLRRQANRRRGMRGQFGGRRQAQKRKRPQTSQSGKVAKMDIFAKQGRC